MHPSLLPSFLSSLPPSLLPCPEQQYKVEVYQQQIDMEKLCHQGELLLKKVSDQTDRDMIQEPLTELRHLWENLGEKITHRQVTGRSKQSWLHFTGLPSVHFSQVPFTQH